MPRPVKHRPYDPNRPASAADQLTQPAFVRAHGAVAVQTPADLVEDGSTDAVMRNICYEQIAPDAVLLQVRDEGHVTIIGGKTADSPLNYLHRRVAPRNRISDIQYAAAIRYHGDHLALGRIGSNTASTIEHLLMAPTLTAEDKWMKQNDMPMMRMASESKTVVDKSDKLIAAAWKVKRLEKKLDGWESSMLRDLIVYERTVGMIATRWGMQPEAASTLVKMALWKLARVYESVDHEFQAWLSMERQMRNEAK